MTSQRGGSSNQVLKDELGTGKQDEDDSQGMCKCDKEKLQD